MPRTLKPERTNIHRKLGKVEELLGQALNTTHFCDAPLVEAVDGSGGSYGNVGSNEIAAYHALDTLQRSLRDVGEALERAQTDARDFDDACAEVWPK